MPSGRVPATSDTMTSRHRHTRRTVLSFWAVLLLCIPAAGHAAALEVRHDLRVSLAPATRELAAADRISSPNGDIAWPALRLSPRAGDITVTLDGRRAAFTFRQGRLKLAGNPTGGVLEIAYRCVFDDPVPRAPANSDNPGYGVTGTISARGTFLLSGAGWYPRVAQARAVYHLAVDAPRGILAVTAGRPMGHIDRGGRTVSRWRITRPVEGLALSAGPYAVRRKDAAGIPVMTYFFADTAPLAGKYLAAAGRYLSFYQDLFGPYPFEKFAVVENFFPTGYGFPSYTLIGGRVLRLPFIVHTSLPHEIAHSWWGNGVLVDYRGGNWCEGLTSYVSDYYLKERRSADSARRYRLQMLRDYTTLVSPERDFPLSRFTSRVDPVSRAIGYDKGAMVFHMLRRKVGDRTFWQALRDTVRRRLFKATGWNDLRDIFQQCSKIDLKPFFRQWVTRKGAPLLTLEKPSAKHTEGGWRTTAAVTQAKPCFELDVEAALQSRDGRRVRRVRLSGVRSRFSFTGPGAPRRLAVDPDFQVMRRLHPAELPPVVNSLKGSAQVSLVLLQDAPRALASQARTLVKALGIVGVRTVTVKTPIPGRLPPTDLIVAGRYADLSALLGGPYARHLRQGILKDTGGRTLFAVLPHPTAKGRVMALFCPQPAPVGCTAARKITHYGRYSYLVFQNGRIEKRGTWPVVSSPLIYRWPRDHVGG